LTKEKYAAIVVQWTSWGNRRHAPRTRFERRLAAAETAPGEALA
jgi:hypothetical protein